MIASKDWQVDNDLSEKLRSIRVKGFGPILRSGNDEYALVFDEERMAVLYGSRAEIDARLLEMQEPYDYESSALEERIGSKEGLLTEVFKSSALEMLMLSDVEDAKALVNALAKKFPNARLELRFLAICFLVGNAACDQ
ncbi:MAG: hypothetical protein P8X51_13880, partial [Maritimibacter sp.]